MPRLVVQIPALNEAGNIGRVIRSIPRDIPGVDEVKVLVIDDGSEDDTAEKALAAGADLVVRHRRNRGLAAAFTNGLRHSLALGADIIVNTDGDGQYPGSDIPRLVEPILNNEADMVVGDRQPGELEHFSWLKQRLQLLGTSVIRMLTGQDITDATSGFRSFSRDLAVNLDLTSKYTYTLETLFQASVHRFKVISVVIKANPTDRKSRLMKSIPSYLLNQGRNILTFWIMYKPLQVFSPLGILSMLIGFFLAARYFWFQLVSPDGSEHLAALTVGSVMVVIGIFVILLAFLAEFVSGLRSKIDNLIVQQKNLDLFTRGLNRDDPAKGLEGLAAGVDILLPPK